MALFIQIVFRASHPHPISALVSFCIFVPTFLSHDAYQLEWRKTHNVGHQRRARTAASDKPCMRDMLIARPLHAFVRLHVEATQVTDYELH
jgi:hypothetical protein